MRITSVLAVAIVAFLLTAPALAAEVTLSAKDDKGTAGFELAGKAVAAADLTSAVAAAKKADADLAVRIVAAKDTPYSYIEPALRSCGMAEIKGVTLAPAGADQVTLSQRDSRKPAAGVDMPMVRMDMKVSVVDGTTVLPDAQAKELRKMSDKSNVLVIIAPTKDVPFGDLTALYAKLQELGAPMILFKSLSSK